MTYRPSFLNGFRTFNKKTMASLVKFKQIKKEHGITKSRCFFASTISGFILIETLVALSLLMLALPAALTVASKSVSLASYSKDQVIALYLAQEGIEIIRNRRDQNMIKMSIGDTVDWRDGFWTGDCSAPLRCRVDYGAGPSDTDTLIERCVGGGCSLVLNRNMANGTYAHTPVGGAWVSTPFSRFVQTSAVAGSPDEIRVVSTVTYGMYGGVKTISVVENLTKWIQNE